MFFFGGKGLYGLKVGGIAKDGMAHDGTVDLG